MKVNKSFFKLGSQSLPPILGATSPVLLIIFQTWNQLCACVCARVRAHTDLQL